MRSDRSGPTVPERLSAAVADAWPALVRRGGRRAVPALGVVLALAAAGVALRPAAPGSRPGPDVVGRSVQIPPPRPPDAAPRPIRATYRVGPSRSGTRLVVERVTGPHLVRSTVRVSRTVGDDGSQVVTVSAVADCRNVHVLGPALTGYRLAVTMREPDGSSAGAHVRVPPSPVDWGAAVRQDCWQRTAAAAVSVGTLHAVADRFRREVRLTVPLVSALARDIRVAAVDVADVDTIDAADSGTLTAGGGLRLRVRLPVPDCTVAALPAALLGLGPDGVGRARAGLLWSVGPVRADPAASFVTELSPAGRATVLAAVRRLCAPPATTVRVTGSRTLPANPVVRDRDGVAIAVRLEVLARQPVVDLGADPGPAATSDARVATTAVRVRPVDGRGRASLVWRASCASPAPPPLTVPVHLRVHGRRTGWSVTLDGPGLARTYAAACDLPAAALVAGGWPPLAP